MSLDERLAWLQQQIGSAPEVDPEEARRQAEQDLEEIGQLGLVDRAWSEFTGRLPGAALQEWRIGYFATKETVWCDARYRLPGDAETRQKEFGFRREPGGTWELLWEVPAPLLEEL